MAEHWKVIDQRETVIMQGSRFVDVLEVTFETDQGVVGTVDIPRSQYSPDTVRDAVDKEVEKRHGVQQL